MGWPTCVSVSDQPEAARALIWLLHHPGDTAVLDAVTQGLLRRNDLHGVRLIAREWGNPADIEHLDHIYGEITVYLHPDGPIQDFVDLTAALTSEPDHAVRAGARQLGAGSSRRRPVAGGRTGLV